jgi:hypothetical protein
MRASVGAVVDLEEMDEEQNTREKRRKKNEGVQGGLLDEYRERDRSALAGRCRGVPVAAACDLISLKFPRFCRSRPNVAARPQQPEPQASPTSENDQMRCISTAQRLARFLEFGVTAQPRPEP